MEFIWGMVGEDFTLLASDTQAAQSIIVFKSDEDKATMLDDNLVMLISGVAGDTVQFAEFIEKNVKLYKVMNGVALSPSAAANFTRGKMASFLRSRSAYTVNMLMGGYDVKKSKPELFFLDYLASMNTIPFGAHGYGAHFTLSIMDRYYKKGMTREEALDVLKKCIHELQTRFIINLPTFHVRIVDKDGVHVIPFTCDKKAAA